MKACRLILIFAFIAWGSCQSLWLETGIGYVEQESSVYQQRFKLTLRGLYPVNEQVSAFAALHWQEDFDTTTEDALMLDVGAWFPQPAAISDPFGWQSHLAVGASLVDQSWGAAFILAGSYELRRNLELVLVYTHRPLFYPRLAQAFDVGFGLKVNLD